MFNLHDMFPLEQFQIPPAQNDHNIQMLKHAEQYQRIITEASSVAVDVHDAARSQNALSVILSRVNTAYNKLIEMQKTEISFHNVSAEEYKKMKKNSKDLIS